MKTFVKNYEFPKGSAEVTFEESGKNWYVTIRPLSRRWPVTVHWRVSKQEAKDTDGAAWYIYNRYANLPLCILNKW